MKTLKFLFFLVTMSSIISCDKNDSEEIDPFDYEGIENIEVENYIELLKLSQYDSFELPEFSYSDIPALLKYRKEDQMITNFPHNSLSSLYGSDCKLGMYILWTIESIRAVAINSEYLSGRFPSLNPVLALRNADELVVVRDDESHEIAAKAYFDWWDGNRRKEFDEFKTIDPLIETKYRWH